MSAVRRASQSVVTSFEKMVWSVLARLRGGEKMWQLIDRTGIVGFGGPNGSGKSLAAVHAVLRALENSYWECNDPDHHHNRLLRNHVDTCSTCDPLNRRWCEAGDIILGITGHGDTLAYSTVIILGPDGREHPLYRPLIDYRQLLTIEHAVVLFDEVAGVSDASSSASTPVQVTRWMHTLRKSDVRLFITSPDYDRCSKPIRQVLQVWVDARSFFPELADSGRRWRPRQAMLYRAYDAMDFAHFTAHAATQLKVQASCAFWRPGCLAERSYNTLGQVLMLGHVTESGLCSSCGGNRPAPKCACTHEVDLIGIGEIEVIENVSASGTRTRKAVPRPTSPDDQALTSL